MEKMRFWLRRGARECKPLAKQYSILLDHQQASRITFLCTHLHMENGIADGEYEVHVDVQVEAHYIHLLDSPSFQRLIV